MLCITRKEGQSVIVGKATITVYRTRDGQVRLAIDAPRDVPVVRKELLERDAAA